MWRRTSEAQIPSSQEALEKLARALSGYPPAPAATPVPWRPVPSSQEALEKLARALSGYPPAPAATPVPWRPVPRPPLGGGVYIFARGDRAIYVGETECLAARLVPSHERWLDALGYGATHVDYLEMPYATKAERLNLERDLREQYWPVMNPPRPRARELLFAALSGPYRRW